MAKTRRIGILVAIDDREFDLMMNERIVMRSGLVNEFRGFLDAREAMEFLRQTDHPPVDAILLNINMPLMDGFEFLEMATAEFGDAFARIVVLMLTTSLVQRDRERAMQFAAVKEFSNKPLKVQLLKQITGHLLAA
ncbi:MAG: response regulator [Pseudomonadota bacterium]